MGRCEADAILPSDLRARLAEWGEAVGAAEQADILVTGWGSAPLTANLLARTPRARVVLHAAGSVKWLVTDAVWERGIVVSSAADANAGPVADYALAAITFAAKRAVATASAYASGAVWPGFTEREGGDGRTVGVIGASRIGRRVLERLITAGTGCRVLLYDPYVSAVEAARLGVEAVSLEELCGSSSVITLHAPEVPETRHMMDARRLALIPDGGTVVNTARGSLIDTEALVRECASGRLDAFLDVTEPEPLPAGHPLFSLPNVLVTPHIAGAQGSEVRRLGKWVVEETERWVRGLPLSGRVRREDLCRLA
ncbi:hydroxyacid dehydrogenase [Streptomyces sp. UNOB3_S3]|uniref:hydroxyacid dehydrogenase n=1 Tax=Streptomyces sp. UNOB3_S3 TaxID=2871682 RepID=UPI001E57B77F|nr:hydroxyacid dehydrogenase [Streptomyces sp. UNOB3_S3]MCC3779635.1 hydroxyacid dehydrogenase [Streptomyces sp. UNOB3_S3]